MEIKESGKEEKKERERIGEGCGVTGTMWAQLMRWGTGRRIGFRDSPSCPTRESPGASKGFSGRACSETGDRRASTGLSSPRGPADAVTTLNSLPAIALHACLSVSVSSASCGCRPPTPLTSPAKEKNQKEERDCSRRRRNRKVDDSCTFCGARFAAAFVPLPQRPVRWRAGASRSPPKSNNTLASSTFLFLFFFSDLL